jgi:hypothetical protein
MRLGPAARQAALWAALIAVLVAAAVWTIRFSPLAPRRRAQVRMTVQPAPEPQDDTTWRVQMLQAVNAERAKENLAPLCLNAKLDRTAKDHIEYKVRTGFTDPHVGEGGTMPWDRARVAGYVDGFIGENIAAGDTTVDAAMRGWMASPPHRANIMRDGFVHLGLARVNNKFWGQVFGSSAKETCMVVEEKKDCAKSKGGKCWTRGYTIKPPPTGSKVKVYFPTVAPGATPSNLV